MFPIKVLYQSRIFHSMKLTRRVTRQIEQPQRCTGSLPVHVEDKRDIVLLVRSGHGFVE